MNMVAAQGKREGFSSQQATSDNKSPTVKSPKTLQSKRMQQTRLHKRISYKACSMTPKEAVYIVYWRGGTFSHANLLQKSQQ